MKRLTYEAEFCEDVILCDPGSCHCGPGGCFQKCMWDRLKAYEDTGLSPEEVAIIQSKDTTN